MSISYPAIAPATTNNTSTSARPQYAFNAVVGSTYPIIISGSTESLEAATLFAPPQELYKTSGSYSLFVVGKISGSNITGSLEIDTGPGGKYNAFLSASSNAIIASKFSGSDGYFNVQFSSEQIGINGVSLPLTFSGSASNYTASIYGIYFSPTI